MTGQPDIKDATELMKQGVVDYWIKPVGLRSFRSSAGGSDPSYVDTTIQGRTKG